MEIEFFYKKKGMIGMISYTFHISNKDSALSTTNKLLNVSKHNLRAYNDDLEKNEYNKNNISVLVGSDSIYKDVQKIYHEEFDEAIRKYNETKIKSRQIDDYFKHVSNSNNDLAVECIIQIGDKDFWQDKKTFQKKTMNELFQNQVNKLQELAPGFKIASAVIHYDESSPHMHVVGVPVAEFEKGLEKRVSKRQVFNRESLKMLQHELRRDVQEHFKEYDFLKEESLKDIEKGRNKDIPKRSLEEFYELKDDIELQNKSLNKVVEALNSKENELNDVNIALNEKNSDLELLQGQINNLNFEKDNIQNELNDLKNDIDIQQELNIQQLQELERTKKELESKEKALKALKIQEKEALEAIKEYQNKKDLIESLGNIFFEKVVEKTFFKKDKIVIEKSTAMPLIEVAKNLEERLKNVDLKEKQLIAKEQNFNQKSENIIKTAEKQASAIISRAEKQASSLDNSIKVARLGAKLGRYEKAFPESELIERERQRQHVKFKNKNINDPER